MPEVVVVEMIYLLEEQKQKHQSKATWSSHK